MAPTTTTTGGGLQGLSGAFLIRSAREGNFMIQSYVTVSVGVWVLARELDQNAGRVWFIIYH
jgi:hypothetical protein